MEVRDWSGGKVCAKCRGFAGGDEQSLYMQSVGSYSGSVGDSLGYYDSMAITAKEADNDLSSTNCAVTWKGARWYSNCHRDNMNGNTWETRSLVMESLGNAGKENIFLCSSPMKVPREN